MKVLVVCVFIFLYLVWALFKSGSDADKKIKEMMEKEDINKTHNN